MALDWNKEISFTGLRKRGAKQSDAYPTKTYMNLAVADHKTHELRKVVPAAVIVIVAVVVFLKFGVFDFIAQVNAKQAELAQQQQTLASVEAKLANYDEVLAEYQSYASAQLASDSDSVSTLQALDLVSRRITPVASVASLSYEKNSLLLNLSNITLSAAGDLVSSLYQEPIVANVTVSTATTGVANSDSPTVTMAITLQKAGD
ncbi:MAG: hypothetical protein IJ087_10695 [Eggerthellaceae bacterium]|nr:hypothetical protein [Eggerthellaceae bacterium]